MKKLARVRAELERITNESGGLLTPQAVIDVARDPTSVLHEYFTWDDEIAAEEWRKQQARQLISKIKVRFEGREVQQYWNTKVKVNNEEFRGYVTKETLISDDEIYARVIADAVEELEHWKTKYKEITELRNIISDEKLSELKKKRKGS